jgi:hypothetical protein
MEMTTKDIQKLIIETNIQTLNNVYASLTDADSVDDLYEYLDDIQDQISDLKDTLDKLNKNLYRVSEVHSDTPKYFGVYWATDIEDAMLLASETYNVSPMILIAEQVTMDELKADAANLRLATAIMN